MLYLQAGQDRLIRPRAGHEIVRLARQAQHVAIDAPHFLFQLAPKVAVEEIGRFLRAR